MSTYMYIVYRNVGASANVFLILEQKNKNKKNRTKMIHVVANVITYV